ncbi:reverse transcriptase domain-containing protein [Tanacetum coccineum]
MNQKADMLSKLASVAFNHLTKEVLVEVLNERSTEGQEVHTIVEEDGDNWMTPHCSMPGGRSPLQANYVIREIHMGSCCMHVGPRAVVRKVIRQGYYWPTMHEDAKEEWGMDILRLLPPARGGAKFMIVAIDYFTKWIEAKPLVKITVNDPFKSWCGRFEIQQMNTAMAHPQANRLVERANRSLMEGIKTRLGREKARWVDELPKVLWAHRTSNKQSNEETPFSLTYGSETVIPAEIGIPTYRTLMIMEGYNEEEMRLNLDLLQEKREATAVREAKYKTKIEQYYNKKVRPAGFRQEEFVL